MTRWVEKLRRHRAEILKFAVVGGVSRATQTLVLFVLTDKLGVWYVWSSLVAVGVVFVFGFMANRFWTFKR